MKDSILKDDVLFTCASWFFQLPAYVVFPGIEVQVFSVGWWTRIMTCSKMAKEINPDIHIWKNFFQVLQYDSIWPVYLPVGGHLTFKRVTHHHPIKLTNSQNWQVYRFQQLCILKLPSPLRSRTFLSFRPWKQKIKLLLMGRKNPANHLGYTKIRWIVR